MGKIADRAPVVDREVRAGRRGEEWGKGTWKRVTKSLMKQAFGTSFFAPVSVLHSNPNPAPPPTFFSPIDRSINKTDKYIKL
jgi:hypothetical protein